MPRPDSVIVTVSSAGTAVAISTDPLPVDSFVVQADPGNTGNIFVGDVNVDNTKAPLTPGDILPIGSPQSRLLFDLSTVYIDAATNGDKANVFYVIP